ncbi:MAG: HNH endonuclease signature motif containing protein [Acidimicrobiales bacterium]
MWSDPVRPRHHIRYWEHHGSTDLDNLVLLCSRHHRLLHDGDYSCVMGADQRPSFLDPNGDPLTGRTADDDVSPMRAWHERQRRRAIDPTAAAARTGGEPLTDFALDVLVTSLLDAA